MTYRTLLIAAALALLGPLSAARAVIVILKGDGGTVKGYLVRERQRDGEPVVEVNVPQPDGTKKLRTIERSQIDLLLKTVSQERLATLRADNPQAYRDYAEELAEKRDDPEARDTSLRLYQIAAYLDPDRLGRSCLLGMAALARTPAEERTFRAMVYLLDPEHDARVLKKTSGAAAAPRAAVTGSTDDLEAALRLLRQNRHREAQYAARRDNVKQQFELIRDYITYDEFTEICEKRESPSDAQLRQVLLAEASLIRFVGGADAVPEEPGREPAPSAESWSQIMAEPPPLPVPSLSLKTLTEFDPEQCVYRDGKWVKP